MKSPTLAYRTALFNALQGIVFLGQNISVFEEVANSNQLASIKKINVGNVPVEAYIIIQNQTANDISAKCLRSDQVSCQVQITTLFPIGSGGSKTAEQISELILEKVYDNPTVKFPNDSDFFIWKNQLESTRNIPYQTDTHYAWVHNMTFIAWIGQN